MDYLDEYPKNLSGKRLGIEECRKIAPELKDLSDEKLLEARDLIYEYVDIIFQVWHSMPAEKRDEIKKEYTLKHKGKNRGGGKIKKAS